MDQVIHQDDHFIPHRYAHQGKQSGAQNTQIPCLTPTLISR